MFACSMQPIHGKRGSLYFGHARAFFGFTGGLHDWNLAFVAGAKSGVMIPFSSSEGIERERSGGFRYFTEHFLTFYD